MAYQAKRAFQRKFVREAVRIVTKSGISFATYEDLSAGGLRLWVDHEIPMDSVIEVQFSVRSKEGNRISEVRTLGRVVRCIKRDGSFDVGLQFLDLQPSTRYLIQSLVDSTDGPF